MYFKGKWRITMSNNLDEFEKEARRRAHLLAQPICEMSKTLFSEEEGVMQSASYQFLSSYLLAHSLDVLGRSHEMPLKACMAMFFSCFNEAILMSLKGSIEK